MERLSEGNLFISEVLSVFQSVSSKDLMVLAIKGPCRIKLLK